MNWDFYGITFTEKGVHCTCVGVMLNDKLPVNGENCQSSIQRSQSYENIDLLIVIL